MPEPTLTAWDVETDPANPRPNIWPQCPTCDVSFVWKRGLSMTKGWMWFWSPGCKHKSQPVLMTGDGPYESQEVKSDAE